METPACQLIIKIDTSVICDTLSQCLGRRVDKGTFKEILFNDENMGLLTGSFIKSETGELLGTVESVEDVNGSLAARVTIAEGIEGQRIKLYPRVGIVSNQLCHINLDAVYF